MAGTLLGGWKARSRLLLGLARWTPICAAVGVMAGCASALLLWSLQVATRLREAHPWLIFLLAPAGLLVGLMYHYAGRRVEAGNNLILEEIHAPREVISWRMTPLILIGTFVTHVFGGSAGREGTALQTGASLADQMTRPLRLNAADRRILLMAGVSAGFASVFGTPLAGAVFGIEVLAIGSLGYEAIGPCFLAAFVGDMVTRAWHVDHTMYAVTQVPQLSVGRVAAAMLAGLIFGLVAKLFAMSAHAISRAAKRWIAFPPLRPFAGGIVITLAVMVVGTRYIGLGLPTIAAAFGMKLPVYDWAGKFAFTAWTLGMGFKGGEVTPLFFIGATLGNSLSRVLPLPGPLLAGMGFAGVFAGAANTPLAATLMAMELFGAEAGAYAGIACVGAYLFSGHAGIYGAQRIGRAKHAAIEGGTEAEAANREEPSGDLL